VGLFLIYPGAQLSPVFARWKIEANVTYWYPVDFENDKPKCNLDTDRFVVEGPWFFTTQVDVMEQVRNNESDYRRKGKKIPFKLQNPTPMHEVKVTGDAVDTSANIRVLLAISLASFLLLALI
jgi:hypothetical protein